jgi:hypothetical protein
LIVSSSLKWQWLYNLFLVTYSFIKLYFESTSYYLKLYSAIIRYLILFICIAEIVLVMQLKLTFCFDVKKHLFSNKNNVLLIELTLIHILLVSVNIRE